MRYRDGRRSICVSSQSGCPLTCTFCATGTMKFGRNLTAAEIVDQALHFRRIEAIDHCVFMGMGEPMMNLDNVLEACERLPDIGITHRRTAISTVGWIPGIERLTESEMPIRLALSLHAPNDALRSELMPVNDRYPLADVLAACRAYHRKRRRMVFVEYVMLAGVNDSRGAREGDGEGPRPSRLQGEPDPVQPDRQLRRLRAGDDPRLPRTSSSAAACGRRSASRAARTSTPPAASSRRAQPPAETSDAPLSLRSRWRRTSDPPGGPRSPRDFLAAAHGAHAPSPRRPASTTRSIWRPRRPSCGRSRARRSSGRWSGCWRDRRSRRRSSGFSQAPPSSEPRSTRSTARWWTRSGTACSRPTRRRSWSSGSPRRRRCARRSRSRASASWRTSAGRSGGSLTASTGPPRALARRAHVPQQTDRDRRVGQRRPRHPRVASGSRRRDRRAIFFAGTAVVDFTVSAFGELRPLVRPSRSSSDVVALIGLSSSYLFFFWTLDGPDARHALPGHPARRLRRHAAPDSPPRRRGSFWPRSRLERASS